MRKLLVNWMHHSGGNDSSGNPRRLFVVQDTASGMIFDVIEEGYSGREAWRLKYPCAVEGVTFRISGGEYQALRKGKWV